MLACSQKNNQDALNEEVTEEKITKNENAEGRTGNKNIAYEEFIGAIKENNHNHILSLINQGADFQ